MHFFTMAPHCHRASQCYEFLPGLHCPRFSVQEKGGPVITTNGRMCFCGAEGDAGPCTNIKFEHRHVPGLVCLFGTRDGLLRLGKENGGWMLNSAAKQCDQRRESHHVESFGKFYVKLCKYCCLLK